MRASGSFGPSDPGPLVGLLAEPDRLKVFAAVVLGATSAADAAASAGVDPKTAVTALERLAAAGVVVASPSGGLVVDVSRFKEAARQASDQRRADDEKATDLGAVSADAAAVLKNFVHRGRLTRIPAAQAKRLVVLDWLAARFEPGEIYPEQRVNAMLGEVHDDTAALRRYLVDAGFLERRDGFYWRAGGTYEIE